MKIGIATIEKDLNQNVNPTFGRAPYFAVYNTITKSVEFYNNEAKNAQGGAGIKASQFLVDLNLDAIIAYRLGENAVKVLTSANINLYSPKENLTVQENIDLLLQDKLDTMVHIHSGYHHG